MLNEFARRIVIRCGAPLSTIIALLLVMGGWQSVSASSGHLRHVASHADSRLHATLPPNIKASGVVTVATDPTTPPYEYLASDNKTIIGADVDLGHAIGKALGVKFEFKPINFAGIIPALEAGRFNVAMSAMGDTPAREKAVDFVDYSTDGNSLIVPKGNPLHIKTMADLCGKNVAVQQGTVMLGLVQAQQKKCAKHINIHIFPTNNDALLQVRTGRDDATINDYAVSVYVINHLTGGGKPLQTLTFKVYGEGYNALAIQKSERQLRNAIQQALQNLINNHTYIKVLRHWGIAAGAVQKATVNDGKRFNQPTG
jgi:polar amino acid transport system substrate-binding protein